MENSYRYYKNGACKYFPCHSKLDESEFNCLFCYCPLYFLDEKCGGNFIYSKKVKDCTGCDLPHKPNYYDVISEKLVDEIVSRSQS